MSQPKISNTQLTGPLFDSSTVIRVEKAGGQGIFTSIKAAIDSITTNTSSTPVTVKVGPGTYVEDPILMKPYVSLESWGIESQVIIAPTTPTSPLITAVSACQIIGLTITGASTSSGVYFTPTINGPTSTFRLYDTTFLGNGIGLHILGNSNTSYVVAHQLYFATFGNSTTNHIRVDNGTGLGEMAVLFTTTGVTHITGQGTGVTESIFVTGGNSHVVFNGISIQAVGGGNSPGDGFVIQDGAYVDLIAGSVIGFNNNIVSRNVGAAPKFHVAVNLSSGSTTRDLSIEHPGTTGLFSGAADKAKAFIDPSSTLSATFANLGVESGSVYVGPFFMGPTFSTISDYTNLFNESLPTGLLFGGLLTQGVNPLDIDISSGYGYVTTVSPDTMKKVSWNSAIVTLPDNTNSYVYVNNLGVVLSAASEPDVLQNVILGRARTSGGIITFISEIPRASDHISSKIDDFLRTAVGVIYNQGSIATENVTPFHLDVTAGKYYYSRLLFQPTGGTNINFHHWYDTLGTWTRGALVNVLDNTQYNNTSTGLTALTASYYTKHVLYVGGDGVNEQYGIVYGQAQYSLLVDAQSAALPTPPPFFTDIITPVAAIIVQQGAANIVQFIDVRTKIGFQSPTVSAPASHGSLLGLLNDDHPQYLLVNGTRAMTGALNMGTNSVTNVGTVDGVTVSAHESRHLPNGLDPLTTAAPSTNLSPSSTNSVGIANSLARSDHSHAITGFQLSSTLLTNIAALTLVNGDLILGTGAATVSRLGVGTINQILTSNGTIPTWSSTLTINSVTFPDTTVLNTNVSHVNNPVSVTSASHTIIATEDYVGVNFAGAVALTLNTVNNKVVYIKDESFAAGTPGNTITITPSSGLIEGQANVTISVNGMALTLVCRAGNWFIV